MKILFYAGILCFALGMNACVSKNVQKKSDLGFVGTIEAAHEKAIFKKQHAIAFDLTLYFRGKERYNGRITQATNDKYIRLEEDSSRVIIVRGDSVFFHPSMDNPEGIRFSAYTWPYFFMLPYKLDDPGTVWTAYPDSTLNNTPYLTQKLSFEDGTGDAPDDWYIVYADTATKRINTAAYIVTSDTRSQEQAEANPHAITYHDYKLINGVPFATRWGFWEWRADSGLTRQIGSANLDNYRFVPQSTSLFNVPTDFKTAL